MVLCGFAHFPMQAQNSVHGRPCAPHDLHAAELHAPPPRWPSGLHEHPGTLLVPVLLRPDSEPAVDAPFRAARCSDRAADPRCGLWRMPTTAATGLP